MFISSFSVNKKHQSTNRSFLHFKIPISGFIDRKTTNLKILMYLCIVVWFECNLVMVGKKTI